MRGILLIIAIAACDAPAPTQPDAAVDAKPPLVLDTLPMNIVVTDRTITVWTEGHDFGDADCVPQHFASVGECGYATDGFSCGVDSWGGQSCITDLGVEFDGGRLQPRSYGVGDPSTYRFDPFGPGELTLVIAGCGHPTTRIPLGVRPWVQPKPIAWAEYADDPDVLVTWTTDRPTTSVIVGASQRRCHVQGVNDYTFDDWQSNYASVLAIESRVDVVSGFGPATIWRGNEAHTMVMRPPSE